MITMEGLTSLISKKVFYLAPIVYRNLDRKLEHPIT